MMGVTALTMGLSVANMPERSSDKNSYHTRGNNRS